MSFTAPQLPLEVYGEANIRLGKIEAEENVTIVMAVESGSRAWGFPSPDSDNDVRFFYVRPISQYVGLTAPRDTVERPIDGVWDLNGWDLGKALRLLVKGNATVAEWLSSPLIYREHGPLPYKLRDLIKRHASPQASARHYYGLTKTCFASEITNRPTAAQMAEYDDAGTVVKGFTEVNYKKYLYALRGACALVWIRRYNEIPPMTLPALMAQDILTSAQRFEINRLLGIKATMGEIGYGRRLPILDDFIQENLDWARNLGFDRMPENAVLAAEANQLLLDALGIG